MSAKSPSWLTATSWAAILSRPARSVLVMIATTGAFNAASSAAMNLSPGPTFSSAGTQKPITSTSASAARTTSLSRSPSRVRGRCRPGVSTMISCASGRFTIPRTARRVVCGLALVMTILLPTRALVSVDLPAFGRPTKQQNPERNVTPASSHLDVETVLDLFQITATSRRVAQWQLTIERSANPVDGIYAATSDYVHAVEVRGADRLLFVAGTMGLDPHGAPGATLTEQLELAWFQHPNHSGQCRHDRRQHRATDQL